MVIPVAKGMKPADFAAALRRAVPDLAQGNLAIDLAGQSEFGALIGRQGRTINVEVSAQNLADAEAAADQVRHALTPLPSLADVRDAFAGTEPVIEVTLRRARIAEAASRCSRCSTCCRVRSAASMPATCTPPTTHADPGPLSPASPTRTSRPRWRRQCMAFRSTTSSRCRKSRAPIEVVRVNQRPVSVVEAVVEKGGTSRAAAAIQDAVSKLTFGNGVQWQITGADAQTEPHRPRTRRWWQSSRRC